MESRNIAVDRAKGIGILLVILGHLLVYKQLFSNCIYYFHMPLFFIISGIFMEYRASEILKDKMIKIAIQLLLPFVLFHGIMLVLMSILRAGEMNWGGVIFQIIFSWGSGALLLAPLWFLPILAISKILVLLVQKVEYTFSKVRVRVAVFFILIVLSVITEGIPEFKVPLRLNAIPSAVLFVYIGYVFKSHILKLLSYRYTIYYVPIALLLLISIAIVNGNVNISIGLFNNYALYLIGACSGVFIVFALTRYDIKHFLEFLGRNSLLIFCINSSLNFLYVCLVKKLTGEEIMPMINISDIFVTLGLVFVTIMSALLVPVITPLYQRIYLKTIYFIWKEK